MLFTRRKEVVGLPVERTLLLFIVSIVITESSSAPISSRPNKIYPANVIAHYIQPCSKGTVPSELNACIGDSIEVFLTHARNGSKELNLPPIEPLHVPHLDITHGKGKERLNIKFQNLIFEGFSSSKVNSARMNLADQKLEVTLKCPLYKISGSYSSEGALYELPLYSEGEFAISMHDVTSTWMLYFSSKKMDNEDVATVNRFIVDISPTNIVYSVNKSFDGDNKLGEALDDFLNENAHEIYSNIKSNLMEVIGNLFHGVTNNILEHFPANLLFTD